LCKESDNSTLFWNKMQTTMKVLQVATICISMIGISLADTHDHDHGESHHITNNRDLDPTMIQTHHVTNNKDGTLLVSSTNKCYQCHNFGLFEISRATDFNTELGLTVGTIVGGGHFCGDTFAPQGALTPRGTCSQMGNKCVKLEDDNDNIIRGCIPKVKADMFCSSEEIKTIELTERTWSVHCCTPDSDNLSCNGAGGVVWGLSVLLSTVYATIHNM